MPETSEGTQTYPLAIEQDGSTFHITVAVPQMEQRHEAVSPLLGGDRTGLEAQLKLTQGDEPQETTFFLSRLVDEKAWIIDAKFGPNGFPHWSHGFGSRVTIPKGILPEIEDALDSIARERGLAEQIGLLART